MLTTFGVAAINAIPDEQWPDVQEWCLWRAQQRLEGLKAKRLPVTFSGVLVFYLIEGALRREAHSAMDDSDEARLALLAANVDRYYEQLVLLYSQPLRAFVLRQTGHPQDAEDIVQEAFIRAYYALARYPAERLRTLKARPWLYKITWNCYCNYTSRAKLPPSVSLDTDDDAWPEPEDAVQEQPELAFESFERRRELEALVASLPPRYREVVSLYYFDDLSHQEIANMLNQPIGTVKAHVHRGIRMLRQGLGLETKGGA